MSPSRIGSGGNVSSRLVSNISEEGDPQHSSSYSGAPKNDVDTEHRSRSFEQARTEPTTSHATGKFTWVFSNRVFFFCFFLMDVK